jgi:hypothetical protein
LGRGVEINLRAVAVAGREEREALGMVPVQVAEHDRPVVGLAVEKARATTEQVACQPDAGASVDDQARAFPIASEGETGRVAAVAVEVRSRRWG